MTDKQIEQAAENIAQNLYDYAKQGREPEYNRYDEGYLDAIDVQGSFLAKEGIDWALSNQWISVNDEEPHGNIIIAKLSDKFCGGRGRFEILHFYQGDGLKLIHPQGYYDQCGENIPINAIEYWMPIPKLKEEE